jgi:hypothetical protein
VIVGGHLELEVAVMVFVVTGQVLQGIVTVVVVTVMILKGTQQLNSGDQTLSLPNRTMQHKSAFGASPQLVAKTHFLATLSQIAVGLPN